MRRSSVVLYGLVFLSALIEKTATARNGVNPSHLISKIVEQNGFIYRQARPTDLKEILSIYENLDTPSNKPDVEEIRIADRHKIVIMPMPFRGDHFSNAIEKGRIFVATEPPPHNLRNKHEKVVSILKMFVAEEEAERNTILREELRWSGSHSKRGLCSSGYQRMRLNCVFNYNKPPKFEKNDSCVYRYNRHHTIVYFGGAYTIPEYRNKNISTMLERFALSQLKRSVLDSIVIRKSTHLDYAYGVVTENVGSVGRVRCFADFADYIRRVLGIPNQIDNQDNLIVEVESYMYYAFKPTFQLKKSTRGRTILSKLNDHTDNEGFGCLLSANIEGAHFKFNYQSDSSEGEPDSDDEE